jgi:hypothetical protein
MTIVLQSRPHFPSTKQHTDMSRTKLSFEINDSRLENWMHFYKMWGGWNPTTGRFKKIGLQAGASSELPYPEVYVRHTLDSIAAAVEGNQLDRQKFPGCAFASEEALSDFVQHLRESFLEEWLNERHFYALSVIYGAEQVYSYEALASTLNEVALEG